MNNFQNSFNSVFHAGTNHHCIVDNTIVATWPQSSMVLKRTITWNLVTVLALLGFCYNNAYMGYLQLQKNRINNFYYEDHYRFLNKKVSYFKVSRQFCKLGFFSKVPRSKDTAQLVLINSTDSSFFTKKYKVATLNYL